MKRLLPILIYCLLFVFSSLAYSFDTGITGQNETENTSNQSTNSPNIDELVENNKNQNDTSTNNNKTSSGEVIQIDNPDPLTGDTKLACEAVLCLSSPTKPGECGPSLSRYFSINLKKWSDTVKERKNFLNLCPTASADSNMVSLTNTLAAGAGQCGIDQLNNRGAYKTVVSIAGLNYNQCRTSNAPSFTAKTGKRVTTAYKWVEVNKKNSSSFPGKQNRSYCQKTETYFAVNEMAPGECVNLWNHIYTDYKEMRPKIIKGEQPWDTRWSE